MTNEQQAVIEEFINKAHAALANNRKRVAPQLLVFLSSSNNIVGYENQFIKLLQQLAIGHDQPIDILQCARKFVENLNQTAEQFVVDIIHVMKEYALKIFSAHQEASFEIFIFLRSTIIEKIKNTQLEAEIILEIARYYSTTKHFILSAFHYAYGLQCLKRSGEATDLASVVTQISKQKIYYLYTVYANPSYSSFFDKQVTKNINEINLEGLCKLNKMLFTLGKQCRSLGDEERAMHCFARMFELINKAIPQNSATPSIFEKKAKIYSDEKNLTELNNLSNILFHFCRQYQCLGNEELVEDCFKHMLKLMDKYETSLLCSQAREFHHTEDTKKLFALYDQLCERAEQFDRFDYIEGSNIYYGIVQGLIKNRQKEDDKYNERLKELQDEGDKYRKRCIKGLTQGLNKVKANKQAFFFSELEKEISLQWQEWQKHYIEQWEYDVKKLRDIREEIKEKLSTKVDIIGLQHDFSEAQHELLASFCRAIELEIGSPPCERFSLVCLGSLARDEPVLFSDLECALVWDGAQDHEHVQLYFKIFMDLLQIKLISLGETHQILLGSKKDTKQVFCFSTKELIRGLRLDEGGNYPFCRESIENMMQGSKSHNLFVGTIEEWMKNIRPTNTITHDSLATFKQDMHGFVEDHIALYTSLNIKHLYGNPELTSKLTRKIHDTLNEMVLNPEANGLPYRCFLGYATDIPPVSLVEDKLNVKKYLLHLPQRIVAAMRLFYGIPLLNSVACLDVLQVNHYLDKTTVLLLRTLIESGFRLRMQVQACHHTENDIIEWAPEKKLSPLNEWHKAKELNFNFALEREHLSFLLENLYPKLTAGWKRWQERVNTNPISETSVNLLLPEEWLAVCAHYVEYYLAHHDYTKAYEFYENAFLAFEDQTDEERRQNIAKNWAVYHREKFQKIGVDALTSEQNKMVLQLWLFDYNFYLNGISEDSFICKMTAIQEMLQYHDHSSHEMRQNRIKVLKAVSALGMPLVGNDLIIQRLLDNLRHDDGDVRFQVRKTVSALGASLVESDVFIRGLLANLMHVDWRVSYNAREIIRVLDTLLVRNAVFIQGIIDSLRHNNCYAIDRVLEVVNTLGAPLSENDEIIKAIADSMGDDDGLIQKIKRAKRTIRILRGDYGNTQKIIVNLRDDDKFIRQKALKDISELGDFWVNNKEIVQGVIDNLLHDEDIVRQSALKAIRSAGASLAGNKKITQAIVKNLRHTKQQVRASASDVICATVCKQQLTVFSYKKNGTSNSNPRLFQPASLSTVVNNNHKHRRNTL